MLLITLLFGSLKKLTEVSQFTVEMATPDVPTVSDDDLESRDLAKKTFELVQQLSTRVQSLEAAASSSKDSVKRPREQHSDSGDESKEEEDLPKDKKAKTFIVSSPTKAFLQSAFCLPKPLTNSTRRNLLEKFGLPEGNEARCPKLDPIIKGELPKKAIDTDKKLSRLQNLALDATGPLVHALEELSMKDTPDADVVLQGIQEALVLLGNASCRISGEQRSRALTKLNPDLKSLAEEEDYSDAQPFLFGKGFEQKAKERAEASEGQLHRSHHSPRSFFGQTVPVSMAAAGAGIPPAKTSTTTSPTHRGNSGNLPTDNKGQKAGRAIEFKEPNLVSR